MAPDDLNFDDIDELIDALNDVAVRASMNPNEVPVPGVYVRFTGLPDPGTLGACKVGLTLYLVAEKPPSQAVAYRALAALWNTVRPVVTEYGGPSGPVTATGLVLPSSPVALPALAVPLDLTTVQEGEA